MNRWSKLGQVILKQVACATAFGYILSRITYMTYMWNMPSISFGSWQLLMIVTFQHWSAFHTFVMWCWCLSILYRYLCLTRTGVLEDIFWINSFSIAYCCISVLFFPPQTRLQFMHRQLVIPGDPQLRWLAMHMLNSALPVYVCVDQWELSCAVIYRYISEDSLRHVLTSQISPLEKLCMFWLKQYTIATYIYISVFKTRNSM